MACRRVPPGGFVEAVEVAPPKSLFLGGEFRGIGLEGPFASFGTEIDLNAVVAGFGRCRGWIYRHAADRIDEIVLPGL